MALSAADLASKMVSQIEASAGSSPSNPALLQAYCLSLATAIVTEIQTNAQVLVEGVQNGSGTTTGTVE